MREITHIELSNSMTLPISLLEWEIQVVLRRIRLHVQTVIIKDPQVRFSMECQIPMVCLDMVKVKPSKIRLKSRLPTNLLLNLKCSRKETRSQL